VRRSKSVSTEKRKKKTKHCSLKNNEEAPRGHLSTGQELEEEGEMRERMSCVRSAALSAVAAALILVAIVLNADQRNVRLLARCNSLASSCKSNDMAALDDDAPLTFAADGSISADTARQWRKKVGDQPLFLLLLRAAGL